MPTYGPLDTTVSMVLWEPATGKPTRDPESTAKMEMPWEGCHLEQLREKPVKDAGALGFLGPSSYPFYLINAGQDLFFDKHGVPLSYQPNSHDHRDDTDSPLSEPPSGLLDTSSSLVNVDGEDGIDDKPVKEAPSKQSSIETPQKKGKKGADSDDESLTSGLKGWQATWPVTPKTSKQIQKPINAAIPVKVQVDVTRETFMMSLFDMKHSDICINIYYNGQLTHSKILRYATVRASDADGKQHNFSGRRVGTSFEVPFVLQPLPSTSQTSGVGRMTFKQRWHHTNQLLLEEADEWGRHGKYGIFRSPIGEYLEELSKLDVPERLRNPGTHGQHAGIVDIVIGLGRSLVINTISRAIWKPERKLPEAFCGKDQERFFLPEENMTEQASAANATFVKSFGPKKSGKGKGRGRGRTNGKQRKTQNEEHSEGSEEDLPKENENANPAIRRILASLGMVIQASERSKEPKGVFQDLGNSFTSPPVKTRPARALRSSVVAVSSPLKNSVESGEQLVSTARSKQLSIFTKGFGLPKFSQPKFEHSENMRTESDDDDDMAPASPTPLARGLARGYGTRSKSRDRTRAFRLDGADNMDSPKSNESGNPFGSPSVPVSRALRITPASEPKAAPRLKRKLTAIEPSGDAESPSKFARRGPDHETEINVSEDVKGDNLRLGVVKKQNRLNVSDREVQRLIGNQAALSKSNRTRSGVVSKAFEDHGDNKSALNKPSSSAISVTRRGSRLTFRGEKIKELFPAQKPEPRNEVKSQNLDAGKDVPRVLMPLGRPQRPQRPKWTPESGLPKPKRLVLSTQLTQSPVTPSLGSSVTSSPIVISQNKGQEKAPQTASKVESATRPFVIIESRKPADLVSVVPATKQIVVMPPPRRVSSSSHIEIDKSAKTPLPQAGSPSQPKGSDSKRDTPAVPLFAPPAIHPSFASTEKSHSYGTRKNTMATSTTKNAPALITPQRELRDKGKAKAVATSSARPKVTPRATLDNGVYDDVWAANDLSENSVLTYGNPDNTIGWAGLQSDSARGLVYRNTRLEREAVFRANSILMGVRYVVGVCTDVD